MAKRYRKSRVHVHMVITGYVDVDHIDDDPGYEVRWYLNSPDDIVQELDEVQGNGVITKIESLDPPLTQLAGEAE